MVLFLYIYNDITIQKLWCYFMKKKIRFGIVGCGIIADFHANALLEIPEYAQIAGATDVVYDAAEKFCKRHNIKHILTLEEMLASPDVDAISICVPSGYHAQVAIAAANAKKHIVVEKPMAITKEQLRDVQAACKENGVVLTAISQTRFAKSVVKVKKALDDNLLGKILCADIYMKYNRTQDYYDSGSWRGTKRIDGGGALMNQGIHGVDLLIYLAGNIKNVFAISKTLTRKIEVEDTLSAVVNFESGAIGVIQATTSVYPGYPRRLEINGEKGTIVLEETAIKRWDIDNTNYEDIVLQPTYASGHTASTPSAFSTDGHISQYLDFVDALNTDRRPMIDGYEGRKAVDTILAIYESAEQNRPVDVES